ncbi:unnamed protein product, partial [Amoebophrya sp. A25]
NDNSEKARTAPERKKEPSSTTPDITGPAGLGTSSISSLPGADTRTLSPKEAREQMSGALGSLTKTLGTSYDLLPYGSALTGVATLP